MQINSLLTGHSDPSHAGRRAEPMESSIGKPEESSPALSLSLSGPMAALRDVAERYDVTDITPRGLSDMLKELHTTGAISDEQFRELSLIRLDLDLENLEPDESFDLLDFYSDLVAKLRRQGDDESEPPGGGVSPAALQAAAERRMAWLDKMALLQSAPDVIGLDTLV